MKTPGDIVLVPHENLTSHIITICAARHTSLGASPNPPLAPGSQTGGPLNAMWDSSYDHAESHNTTLRNLTS